MITVSSSLAAMNVVISVVCAVVAFHSFRLANSEHASEDARLMAIGLVLFSGGWAIHRAYWAINRGLESMGANYYLTDLYLHASWITLIPMGVTILGAGFILEPSLKHLYGTAWAVKYSMTMLLGWLLTAMIL